MTQNDGGYDFKPPPPEPPPATPSPEAAPVPQSTNPSAPGWVPPVPVVEKAEPEAAVSDAEIAEATDISKHKGIAALGYLFFLIPLVAAPNSKFARYHANQGLLLFILGICVIVAVIILQVGEFINNRFIDPRVAILGWFFACGLVLLQIALLVGWCILWIMGIINASNGEKKPLPVVGHWNLLK